MERRILSDKRKAKLPKKPYSASRPRSAMLTRRRRKGAPYGRTGISSYFSAAQRAANSRRLLDQLLSLIAPPPKITVSEWADQYRQVSRETSPEPGAWVTDKVPYARAVMDAVSDPDVPAVVLEWAIQLAKTEIILNVLGYFIDCDPCSILLCLPTIELAEDFSKERIAPMIRDTECLRRKVPEPKSRDGSNTLRKKDFDGGHLALAGANSGASLTFRPCRVVLCDEVDKYPLSAGTEGDPVNLAVGRTSNFWNSKVVLCSSPKVKGLSRIEAAFETSTMEFWHLPCPACRAEQRLKFDRLDFGTVSLRCEACGQFSRQHQWLGQKGRWIATRPIDEYGQRVRTRGFQLSALCSPWQRWEELIAEFRAADAATKAGDTTKLQVFINTRLGEPWEDRGERVEEDLYNRRELYSAQVPDGVKFLVAGIDVQDNRLEYEVKGYGAGAESWGIEYGVCYGDPKAPAVWQELDRRLVERIFYFGDGAVIKIRKGCIDSLGHATEEVYRWTRSKGGRFMSIQGRAGLGVPLIKSHSIQGKLRTPVIFLGVDTGKELVTSRLRVTEPGPGFCHYPRLENFEAAAGYTERYFDGLKAEKRIVKFERGFKKFVWIKPGKGDSNEPFDIFVYGLAALALASVDLDTMPRDAGPAGQAGAPLGRASSPSFSFGALPQGGIAPEGQEIDQRTGQLPKGFGAQNRPISW